MGLHGDQGWFECLWFGQRSDKASCSPRTKPQKLTRTADKFSRLRLALLILIRVFVGEEDVGVKWKANKEPALCLTLPFEVDSKKKLDFWQNTRQSVKFKVRRFSTLEWVFFDFCLDQCSFVFPCTRVHARKPHPFQDKSPNHFALKRYPIPKTLHYRRPGVWHFQFGFSFRNRIANLRFAQEKQAPASGLDGPHLPAPSPFWQLIWSADAPKGPRAPWWMAARNR